MRILFLGPRVTKYDTRTPEREPLGGTQSAVASLSRELAALGNEVVVVNGVEPHVSDGVRFVNLPCDADMINRFDAMVVVGSTMGQIVRDLDVTIPLILWCHHAADQA